MKRLHQWGYTLNNHILEATLLGLLALLGLFVGLAAPHAHTSSAQSAPPPIAQAQAAAPHILTPVPTLAKPKPTATPVRRIAPAATSAPQPTATPVPPTPTPGPTATPTPPPSPTPTLNPSWVLVGTYSGSAAATLATVTPAAATQVRIDWTCTPGSGSWTIGFQVVSQANPQSAGGKATACQSGNTSGSYVFGAPAGADDITTGNIGCGGTTCPNIGPWSATVYVWQ